MKTPKRFTATWAASRRAYRNAERGQRERAWRRLRGLVNDQLRREVIRSEGQGKEKLLAKT